MEIDSDRQRLVSRRALILGSGQAALVGALIARMYQLQILDSDQYQMLAEENRIDMRLLTPLRGRIVDRSGVELANNRLTYRAVLIPEQAGDVRDTLNRLKSLISLSDQRIDRILAQAARSRSFLPVTVSQNLEWEEFARLNTRITDLPGIQPEAGHSRYYPHPQDFSLLVGYVGPVTEDELAELARDPLFMLPDFRIGKRGLERIFDEALRGGAGSRRVEVNALGREIRELNRDDGVPGRDLELTIDGDLQRSVMERLGQQSAGVAVINIHSGEVLALASAPGFDANEFNFGISDENWRGLLNDPRKPLLNKAVQGQFPPGSTFKMVVAMAAIEAGVVDPSDTVWCGGKTRLGDSTFHCWKKNGHGHLNMTQSIEQSCDLYFYDTARKIGIDKIAEMAERFGLGSAYGLEIDGENPGLVPTREWKKRRIGSSWQEGETMIAGIGQGYLLSTPLQLAVMTARIANGGYDVTPSLRLSMAPDVVHASDAFTSLGVSEAALGYAQRGMIAVTMGSHGTARGSRLRGEGMSMAGKTGTAQVRRISKAERDTGVIDNAEKPWVERDHSLFVGYGPIEDPAYAVAVVVEHGGSGSKVAAPIARDIMRETLTRDPCGLLPRNVAEADDVEA